MLKPDIAAGTQSLKSSGWLKETPSEFADAVLANCHWRAIAAGQTIQHAGDTHAGIFGLARGTVAITTSLGSPDAPMLHIGHPGLWFGYVALFKGRAVPNGIVARSDVLVAGMAQSQLEQLLAKHPPWWRYIGLLGVIYGNAAANIAADMMIRDSARRCAAALLRLADCRFELAVGVQTVHAPLSQDELAAIANLSRTSISTILREFDEQGLISLGYRSVTLNDPSRLRAMVDDV